MNKGKLEHRILKTTLIATVIFIVVYCSYPFIVPHLVSVEQANKHNIKKFENNREFFQEIVDAFIETYSKQSKTNFSIDDIPAGMQFSLKLKGIDYLDAKIENENKEINVTVNLEAHRFWYNSILNNVRLYYNSCHKSDVCDNDKDVLSAHISTICLGNGWFLEVDTDWI